MKLFDLTGDVAVVIGATGALGGAVAEGLAEAGAKVAVLGRNAERGGACVKRIEERGGQAKFFSVDAMSRESLRNSHLEIQKAWGHASILVNAAGGNDPKTTVTAERKFEHIELPDWQGNFELNLVGGVLLPCQEFGPSMISRGQGSIINFGSVSAGIPLSRVVAYSAIAALGVGERQLLRLHFLDGVALGQIGALYGCDKSTVSRKLSAARQTLFEETRRRLRAQLRLTEAELTSLMRLVRSQLHDLSITRLLRDAG